MHLVADNTILPVEQDTAAAWEVFCALSRHASANPELSENYYFKEQMKRAHLAWMNCFVGG